MNSGVLKPDTLRLSSRVYQPQDLGDADAIELRALGGVFRKRWKLLFGAATISAITAFLLVSLMPPTYKAQAKLILDPRKAQIITDGEVVADLDPSLQIMNGEIAILQSNLLLGDVVRTLGPGRLIEIDPNAGKIDVPTATRIEGLIAVIRKDLKVFGEGDSYVIVVEYSAEDRLLAMDMTNAVVNRYLALQVDGRQETIGQATIWLEDRLRSLEMEVAAKEERIATMRTESLLENGGALENAAQQVTTLNNQLVIASAERLTAEAQVQLLDRLLEENNVEEALAVVSSAAIDSLRNQAFELRQQDAFWAETVGPEHPRRAPILADLQRIDREIAVEVFNVRELRRSEAEVARFRELSLQESIVQMEERVLQISRGEIGLRQLEREAAASRQTYEALLARLTETRTQQRLQEADAKLIEEATLPGAPSAPKPKMMALLAGSVAFALAAISVFLGEMTATTFRTTREVQKETGLPVITALPLGKWNSLKGAIKYLRKNPYSVYAESLRQLRTNILMRDETQISESLMILSSAPGEGKTMTTVALAEMAAKIGRSVIVVDCDLRRSTMNRAFGWRMDYDIADFIEGTCSLDEAIHSPTELPFDVLCGAGPRPDVAEELSTLWLKPMVEELKSIYDFVIIDGPALLAVADAIIIARAADTRLYLIEHDKTERSAVRDGLSMLYEMSMGIDGVILNKAPESQQGYYAYD
ncbi:MAG: polysaccharide biosynthesis tyrosine autokinase [Dinoroseobacter sp.]|nr:polysaccharide biosynthesis tyrosine autokinase [Dinoroseobacter sp.]